MHLKIEFNLTIVAHVGSDQGVRKLEGRQKWWFFNVFGFDFIIITFSRLHGSDLGFFSSWVGSIVPCQIRNISFTDCVLCHVGYFDLSSNNSTNLISISKWKQIHHRPERWGIWDLVFLTPSQPVKKASEKRGKGTTILNWAFYSRHWCWYTCIAVG